MLDKKRATGRAFSLKGAYNVVAHLCNALVYAHGATVHGGAHARLGAWSTRPGASR